MEDIHHTNVERLVQSIVSSFLTIQNLIIEFVKIVNEFIYI